MTYTARERYSEQAHIAGPWYVEDSTGAVIAEGLSDYQAHVSAIARTIVAEIEQPDFEGCTIRELDIALGDTIA